MSFRWAIVLHAFLVLVTFLLGLYVLVEKKMLVAGMLVGDVHHYEYPGNILAAVSFFLVSVFFAMVLFENKKLKIAKELLIVAAMILFFVGTVFYS